MLETNWSGRRDLNSRPLHPQRSALPDCATARPICLYPGFLLVKFVSCLSRFRTSDKILIELAN